MRFMTAFNAFLWIRRIDLAFVGRPASLIIAIIIRLSRRYLP
jgi:hypothetical protein